MGRPSRPVVLALAAAAAGLGLALLGPVPREVTVMPSGDAALVNHHPILMADLVAELEQSRGVSFADATPAERAEMLHRMIDEELLVQRALALEMPERDPEVRAALSDGVSGLAAAPALSATPTEPQLRRFYEAHRDNYATQGSMSLTDLVLHVGGFENAAQTEDQALADGQQAVYALRSGAPVGDVKDHFGFVDSGRAGPDEIDFAARLHLGPKLYGVAAKMGDGAVSDPIALADGVHILVMIHRTAPVYLDYESVRNNVNGDYQNALAAVARAANLAFLRSNARILLAPGLRE